LAGGPAGFTRDFSGPVLLGSTTGSRRLTPTGVSPATPELSRSFGFDDDFLLPTGSAAPVGRSHYPGHATPASLARAWFGLFRVRSPLLTESLLFSLPVGTEMFHFPTFPCAALCVQAGIVRHDSRRVSPFGHPRLVARLPAPRGLSQVPTSFFGS
jgi:hypothetical protein